MKLERIGTVAPCDDAFCIHIDPAFRPGLEGLDPFEYAIVLFWCHALDTADARSSLSCPSPYRSGPAALGTFATRTPMRPNPIGVTAIRLQDVNVEAGRIRTPFIDAIEGSPVLDIKPYVAAFDRVRDLAPPAWCDHWPMWLEDSAAFDWQGELLTTP